MTTTEKCTSRNGTYVCSKDAHDETTQHETSFTAVGEKRTARWSDAYGPVRFYRRSR